MAQQDEVLIENDSITLIDSVDAPLTDTSFYMVGKKRVEIVERNDSTYVKVWEEGEDMEFPDTLDELDDFEGFDSSEDSWDWDVFSSNGKQHFRGHWAGIEFGMNNYVDKDFSISRTAENEFMDISTNRSWNINFNFAQYSIPIHPKYAGFVTGMGLEWSNYHFSNLNTIQKNSSTQQIEPFDLNVDLIMNRFQTTYLTVPLLFEVQFFSGTRWQRMYISGGVIGGVKLGAHTKITYSDNGNKKKSKDKSDYYLRPFRYAFTGRIGYKMLKVYMNYYPVSLFLDDKGPELYPVAMGFCVTF